MIIKKTKEEHVQEVLDIRRKLNNLGYNNSHDEIKRLFDVLSTYVINGEYKKDRFVITGYNKIIDVLLLPRQHAENVVRIRNQVTD